MTILPFLPGIYQGDFIGFGGKDHYTPNTITYYFDEVIDAEIIIAPHTYYEAIDDLRNAVVKPYKYEFRDTEYTKWVRPDVTLTIIEKISLTHATLLDKLLLYVISLMLYQVNQLRSN